MNVFDLTDQLLDRLRVLILDDDELGVCGGDQRNVSVPEVGVLEELIDRSLLVEAVLEDVMDRLAAEAKGLGDDRLAAAEYDKMLRFVIIGHDRVDNTFVIRVPDCIMPDDVDKIKARLSTWQQEQLLPYLRVEGDNLVYDGPSPRAVGWMMYKLVAEINPAQAQEMKAQLLEGHYGNLAIDHTLVSHINDSLGSQLSL